MSSIDYINGLPDCLISHILSFLSTKEAASTSVLAKRWRYLFALTPNLDFDDSIYLNPEKDNRKKNKTPRSFVDFVDRVLVLHQHLPLNRFSLKCEDVIHPTIVIGWLVKVRERGVIDLDLDISSKMGYPLPSEMFVSENLVRLKVGVRGVLPFHKVKHVFLPNVKTLCLDHLMVKNSVFAKLLSCCQALEELVLDNLFVVRGSWSVSHNTLERLVFRRSRIINENHKSMSFNTPNLVYLDYSDTIADKYPKVEFSSLVEARLNLRLSKDQLVTAQLSDDDLLPPEEIGDATNFLVGICNVKTLHLSYNTLQVLAYCCKPMPEFNNLIHLTIQTDLEVAWESLPALLKNCPKLETLVFKGLSYGDTSHIPWEGSSVWLSSSSVKKLKVFKYGKISYNIEDMDKQMDMIKYFVEAMPNLEEVGLYYDAPFEGDLEIVSKGFHRLRKVASTKCKIQVFSGNIFLSSSVFSTSSAAGLL